MTDVEYEALIEFQRQQIADLTAERDRLRDESANSSEALMASNEANAVFCEENNDMRDALALLGVMEQEEIIDDMG